MRFDFTDDQYALRDGAREFFEGECTPEHVRAMWEHETGVSEARWKQLADTGFVGLTIPEEYGGLGLGAVDLVLLLEEAGYAGLPEPLLETAAVVAPVLAAHASEATKDEWLSRLATGEALATVAYDRAGDGRWLAAQGHVVDLVLVLDGEACHLVAAEECTVEPQATLDRGRRVAALSIDTGDATRLGDAEAAAETRDRVAAGAAAVLNGVSRRLLDLTIAHVSEREQFGRPVGSFQAVKHKLAETKLLVESARPATWYAAYAIDEGRIDRARAASVAKAYASDAAAKANHESLQCHGGIGFTWEHDLHLWLKRASALQRAYGSASNHRARLAAALLD
ncbi:acyl-CoA dehydrogenase [Egibacter rhizosphaerae]|uniref:Acyl-CoA dehydrogenase n=1 Tax=Egibacter rhizosphaerae TaxID=1670831 RepID=A0A411YD52_9ACTN|nr:acyl-CoA dehydrogenase family protein [Egibacter rhizosphaerae]QBI19102.1 acyl-CoA dehydrogenase [Egibacter rhizosphaerae]